MSITIQSVGDIDRFKKYVSENPTQPLCYVFYKSNLRFPNVYYVGFTAQFGIAKYTYLANHHRMKNLKKNLLNGYSVKIYFKYNEDGLITLLRPTLNKNSGTGICGRYISSIRYVRHDELPGVGEIVCEKYAHKLIKKPTIAPSSIEESVWEHIFKPSVDMRGVVPELTQRQCNQLIYEKYVTEKSTHTTDPVILAVNDEYVKRSMVNKFNSIDGLNSIVLFCKRDCMFDAYIAIQCIFKKNILWHLNNLTNKCATCGKIYTKRGFLKRHIVRENHVKDWLATLNSSNNKYIICGEILEELQKRDYLATISEQDYDRLWPYYRELCTYNMFKKIHFECSPYDLKFIRFGGELLALEVMNKGICQFTVRSS